MPTLSVVIPAYDASRTITAAVRSAVSQQDVGVEVIVVDDGSRDDTAELAAAEPGVTVIRQDNAGPAAARNTGIRAATGDYVGFLDADDRLLPGWGSAVVTLLQAGAQIAVTDSLIVDADSGETVSKYSDEVAFAGPAEQRCRILETNFIQSTAGIRRKTAQALGGFDESLRGVEDWDLWIRILSGGGRAARDSRPLSAYTRGHASLSSNHLAMARQELVLLAKCAELPMDEEARLARQRSIRMREGRLALLLANEQAASGQRRAALRYLAAAIRLRDPRLLVRASATAVAPQVAAAHGSIGRTR